MICRHRFPATHNRRISYGMMPFSQPVAMTSTRRKPTQQQSDHVISCLFPVRSAVAATAHPSRTNADSSRSLIEKFYETLNKAGRNNEDQGRSGLLFRASLPEIEDVLRKHFAKPVEFNHVAEASAYRKTIRLKQAVTSEQVAA
jgi:hypothetical protein